MRLVMDLQACQTTGSRFRGIGRYSMALAKAMLARAGGHEIWVALSGAFPESIEAIRRDMDGLLPPERVRVFDVPQNVSGGNPGHDWQRRAAEALRESWLRELQPDLVHISSLFEGLEDDAVVHIGSDVAASAAAVTLYDLIPWINQSVYLTNHAVKAWYFDKIESLKRARMLLAISESSRKEAIEHLVVPASRVVNISSAADPMFKRLQIADSAAAALLSKYGLVRPFVMYTGGIDHRKNIDGLIRAYGMLPREVRQAHQLAIVCKVHDDERARIRGMAERIGLGRDELVMTGFVSDAELVGLCNLCRLFVFPSWHEGFGLPALEAMACGAPVIAANTSSLPEVVGRADALFDPHSDEAIMSAMRHALGDEAFRGELARHGLERSGLFSWDETARRALDAMEAAADQVATAKAYVTAAKPAKPTLAVVSPFPPERSGIANYCVELLPALAEHYDIELVSDQREFELQGALAALPRRSVAWFRAHADRYARVIYHFGNSPFHEHMFELLRDIPGVVVLHDFFLGHLLRHLESTGDAPGIWWRALFESHGYPALMERDAATGSDEVVGKYPCSWRVVADADGVIVHSRYSQNLVAHWYGKAVAERVFVMPLARPVDAVELGRADARAQFGLPVGAFVVATFGVLNPGKQVDRLLEAWKLSGLAGDSNCVLVLAGDGNDAAHVASLEAIHPLVADASRGRVVKTGFLPQAEYEAMLQAVDVAVQLRSDTRGETSGAVLDCLAHGIPTIANAHGAMAELPAHALCLLPDDFENDALAEMLASLRDDAPRRNELGEAGRVYVRDELAPERIATMYRDAIESFVAGSPRRRLIGLAEQVIAATRGMPVSDAQLAETARAMAAVCPLGGAPKQMLIDVSVLVLTDARSGIQRVVRGVLAEMLANPPVGVRVEPVYVDATGTYRYARRFASTFLGLSRIAGADAEVETSPGDVFLGLDLCAHVVPERIAYFRALRERGVTIQFVLYDLLPANHPEWFPADLVGHLRRWYQAIAEVSDRILAISKAVADEYSAWLDREQPARARLLQIGYFHLGADIESSAPSCGVDEASRRVIKALAGQPVFLMVGTVEPRKGHAQALDAFERLWASDSDAVLVIVGKRGWRVDALADRLTNHPENGRRLHWFEGVSDEALERIYAQSALLLAASFGEGFGLPLIEAARRGLPLLARDIPVFREVAGDNAMYFRGDTASALAIALDRALEAWRRHGLPDPRQIKALTWKESTAELWEAMSGLRDVRTWYGARAATPLDAPAEV